jgi:hypothetical protein
VGLSAMANPHPRSKDPYPLNVPPRALKEFARRPLKHYAAWVR